MSDIIHDLREELVMIRRALAQEKAETIDIVERLIDWPKVTPVTCKQAAVEIMRLRAKIEFLKLGVDIDQDMKPCLEWQRGQR
jgi:hypothetical protein